MNIGFHYPGKRAIDQRNRAAKTLADATQRLGSGYRINSAGDDPAGLAVSEKLRSIDRGLRQGVRNISDGINYIDTVDGAMGEIHTMLDRLKEISVEAANGPYSDMDRSALDLEYGQILSEIDNISDSAEFNGLKLFEQHKPVYSSFVGNISHKKPVVIDETNSEIVVNYTMNGKEEEVTVYLKEGIYSAEECADMMDDVFYGQNMGIIIGLNEDKHFTMELEGGHVNSISGCGASLFYDTTIGSANGFLVGVTDFGETGKLNIVKGVNDTITFHIGNPKEGEEDKEYSITLEPGVSLERDEVIKRINDKINADPDLAGKVSAVEYKNEKKDNVIALASQQVVTGLKGNFIMIDGTSSPIYDISKHSDQKNAPAEFDGKKDVNGVEIVRGRNDWFILNVSYYVGDDQPKPEALRINMLDPNENERVYATAADVVARIQKQLDDAGIPVTVSEKNGTIDMKSDQFGRHCSVSVDKTKVPSGYMMFDLFDTGSLIPKTPAPPDSQYQAAFSQGKHNIVANGAKIPACTLEYEVILADGSKADISFDLAADNYSPQRLADELNRQLEQYYSDLADKLEFVIGPGLELTASGEGGKQVQSIKVDETCTAYRRLIKCTNYIDSSYPKEGDTLDAKVYQTTTETGGPVVSVINGSATGGSVSYIPVTNPQKHLSEEKYFSYTDKSPDQTPGTSVEGRLDEGKPTVMTLPDVLTQFHDNKAVEDLTLEFSFYGQPFKFDIKKGTTIDQVITNMRNGLAGYASVKRDGNSIVVTAAMAGSEKFENVRGTLMRSAVPSEASKVPGAVCDIANNKVTVPPSLELTGVSTHLPVTFDKNTNDNSCLIIYSGDEELYKLNLTGTHNDAGSIATEINTQIKNEEKGGKVRITASATKDGKLILTGTTDMKKDISIGGTTQLDTRKYVNTGSSCRASITIKSINSLFPLKITENVNDKVTFTYTTPSGNYDLDITMPPSKPPYASTNGYDSYTFRREFEKQLNAKLADKGLDPRDFDVSLTSAGLVIRGQAQDGCYFSKTVGGTMDLDKRLEDNTKLDYVTVTGNTATTPGELRNPHFSSLFGGDGLEITGDNNTVGLIVDGNPVKFDLPVSYPDAYHNPSAILAKLQSEFGADRVYVKNGELIILSGQKGKGSKVTVDRSTNTAPIFSRPDTEDGPHEPIREHHECRLLGNVKLNEDVEIGTYNNKMTFDFRYNGNSMPVNVEVLPAGTYNAADLSKKIQESIDAQIGVGVLNVSVEGGNQIKIEGARITNDCEFSNFKGRLFNMVFQDPHYTYAFGGIHSNVDGATAGDFLSFIIGRNPMDPVTDNEIENDADIEIFDEVNDSLIFEFSYLGQEPEEVVLDLDGGLYTREEMAAHIEMKARQALTRFNDADGEPLDVSRFRVTIGAEGLDLSAAGSHLSVDDINKVLVMSFRDYRDGSVENSHVTIEGIRGTAAYRVFYKATRSPEPTRIYGASDLSGGLAIFKDINDEFSFMLDGEPVSIKIHEGFYTADSICDELDKRFEEIGSIVRAFNVDGKLMFRTIDDGDFVIDKFSGSAANLLFYGGDLRNEHTAVGIQYGRRTGSYVWCDKACVSTRLLRLNTTGVTTQERALKALNRIDGAINYLSQQRAVTGAYENRLDRTRERNTIMIENLDNSESAIRDTDVALEQMKYIKEQILLQAQEFLIPREQQVTRDIVTSILDTLG